MIFPALIFNRPWEVVHFMTDLKTADLKRNFEEIYNFIIKFKTQEVSLIVM